MAVLETFTELRRQAISGYSSWITYLYLRQINVPGHADRVAILVNELYFIGVGVAGQTHSIIVLNNLFDREKNRTRNLEGLLSNCRQEGILTEEAINECHAQIESVSSRVKSIVILRGNVFAHAGQSDHAQVFDKADLALEDTEKLFRVAFRVLGIVAKALGTSIFDLAMIESQVLESNHQVVQLLKGSYGKV